MGVIVIISYLFEGEWGLSLYQTGWAIGIMQVGAGIGSLAGAALTRSGKERRTILWCPPVSLLMLIPMAFTTGTVWYIWIFIYGFTVVGPHPTVVGLAQRALPHRSALVSGILTGPTFAVGGVLGSFMMPTIAERYGYVTLFSDADRFGELHPRNDAEFVAQLLLIGSKQEADQQCGELAVPDDLLQIERFPALSVDERLVAPVVQLHANTIRAFLLEHTTYQLDRLLGDMGRTDDSELSAVDLQ